MVRNCAQACNYTASHIVVQFCRHHDKRPMGENKQSKPDVMLSWIKQTAVSVTARGMVRNEKNGAQAYNSTAQRMVSAHSIGLRPFNAWFDACFVANQTAEAVAFYVPRYTPMHLSMFQTVRRPFKLYAPWYNCSLRLLLACLQHSQFQST